MSAARLPAQERARHALARINDFNTRVDDKTRKAYRAYVASLPASIVTGGLGQAVATCMARAGREEGQGGEGNKAAYARLVDDLEDWLCGTCGWSPYRIDGFQQGKPGRQLIQRLTEKGQDAYLIAQAEAIAYLDWLKKLANALLVEEGQGAGGREREGT